MTTATLQPAGQHPVDALADELDQRERQAQADYFALAAEMVEARRVDADHASRVLQAADKTAAELRELVDHGRRRKELQARLAELPSLQKRLAAVEVQLQKLANEKTAWLTDFARRAAGPDTEHSALHDRLLDVQFAEQDLVTGCRNRDVLAEEQRLAERVRDLTHRRQALLGAAYVPPGPAESYRERLEGALPEVLRHRIDQVLGLDDEIAQASERRDAHRQAMVDSVL